MNEKTEYIGDLTCLTMLRAHETPAGALKLVGVAKANLTAQSCTQGATDLETLRRLVACQSDIEAAEVAESPG